MPVIRNNRPSPDDALTNIVAGNGSKSAVRLHQLRYFVAAADYGASARPLRRLPSRSFRSAGGSVISKMNWGVAFHAPCWRCAIDKAGQEFLRNARHALRQIDIGVTKVAAVGRAEQGHITVGIFSSLASGFLFDLLRDFGERHPKVQVDILDGNPPEHVAAVRKLCLDVAFITGTTAWMAARRSICGAKKYSWCCPMTTL